MKWAMSTYGFIVGSARGLDKGHYTVGCGCLKKNTVGCGTAENSYWEATIDAEAIMQIPLCTRHVEDFWAWSEDPKGRFSVRSVYKMIMKTKLGREAWLEGREDVSNSTVESRGWLSLWRTPVPSKLRNFTWRLAQHSLPTHDVLEHRNMATTAASPLCGARDSWRHSLLDCSASRSVWALSNEEMVEHMIRTTEPNAKIWLFAMNESLPADQFTLMIVTLWVIWSSWRKAIHEDIYQTPFARDRFIVSYLQDINFLQKLGPISHATTVPKPSQWQPPPQSYAKINIDASVARDGSRGAVGAICRDDMGAFQGASVVVFKRLVDPTTLEALR